MGMRNLCRQAGLRPLAGCAWLVAVFFASAIVPDGPRAQGQVQGREQAPAQPAPQVPADALLGALQGGNEGIFALGKFLGVGNEPPEVITRRALAIVKTIRERKSEFDPESTLLAIDRITSVASRALASAQVMRVGVDRGFKPKNAKIALDFGPPDSESSNGFEKVTPGDPRLQGAKVGGIRRPDDQELLADGLIGVEKIVLQLEDGSYRIILLTQNLGDEELSGNPFGREIRINGVRYVINRSAPDQWVPDALLSERGSQLMDAAAADNEGFISGAIPEDASRTTIRQEGGALVLQGDATGGRLEIELKGFNETQSYLTGLIVEPVEAPSDLVLSPEARRVITPLELRLALDAELQLEAIAALEEIAPGEGRLPRDIPEPPFDDLNVTSPSA